MVEALQYKKLKRNGKRHTISYRQGTPQSAVLDPNHSYRKLVHQGPRPETCQSKSHTHNNRADLPHITTSFGAPSVAGRCLCCTSENCLHAGQLPLVHEVLSFPRRWACLSHNPGLTGPFWSWPCRSGFIAFSGRSAGLDRRSSAWSRF